MKDMAIERKGMKRLLILGLVLMVAGMVLSFCALQANAQSVVANVGYVGVNRDRTRDNRRINGLDAAISVAVDGTGDIVISARHQNLGSRMDDFFTRDMKYNEISGNFLIPGFNHYVSAGLSSMKFGEERKEDRNNAFGRGYNLETTFLGPVVGVAGVQRLGDAVFNYSGGIHPLATRRENFSSTDMPSNLPSNHTPVPTVSGGRPIGYSHNLSASTGVELRGSVTHMLRQRWGYSGGYYWRRMAPGFVDHGFTIGTTIVLFN